MTSDSKFTIRDDFPSVSYQQWRSVIEQRLKDKSFEEELVTRIYEGIDVQPVYTRDDESHLGPRPIVDVGWELCQEHSHPDLNTTREAILDDVQNGVTSLLLRFDSEVQRGIDPDEKRKPAFDGLVIANIDDLELALGNVPVDGVSITLDLGAAYLPMSAILVALWQRRGVSQDAAEGSFNADPFTAYVSDEFPPEALDEELSHVGKLAEWTSKNFPKVRALGVDTTAYHDVGATATQELAFAIATGVEYLRAMTPLDIDSAARQFEFHFSVGTRHFLSIAKLRAARQLWARVVETCGGSAAAREMRIHARTSNRVLSQQDPYVNLIRNAIAVFSAGIGGANAITSLPFDHAIGLPDEFSRRVARNTVNILKEEAHLNRVVDPAGGSWFIDQLTRQLAEKSWELFQEIERRGGMRAALENGWVHEQIDSANAREKDECESAEVAIVGVTEFLNVDEEPIVRAKPDFKWTGTRPKPDLNVHVDWSNPMPDLVDAAMQGATIGQMMNWEL